MSIKQNCLDVAINVWMKYYNNYYNGTESLYITQIYFDNIIWDITHLIGQNANYEKKYKVQNFIYKKVLEQKIRTYERREKIFQKIYNEYNLRNNEKLNELKNKYYLKDFHNIEQLLEYLDIKKSKADYEKEYQKLGI